MLWYWLGGGLLGLLALFCLLALVLHVIVLRHYMPFVGRIFQEKPLFIIPVGQPREDVEEVSLRSSDGIELKAIYLRTPQPRKGVILFGLEFGSNRWSCLPYCEFLSEAGYDIFACETRGQGSTEASAGYEPLQWVTTFEVEDYRTAIEYLKSRPDVDPRGVGLFGLSKGGSAGILAASAEPFVRCVVTDGAFGTMTTVLPYMIQWVTIYTRTPIVHYLPEWYFRHIGRIALRQVEAERGVRYPSLVRSLRTLGRPLLMIHGGADNYIKPDMARSLFDAASEPKELWIVDKAKHNQAFHVAGDEYKRRIREFFDIHLGGAAVAPGASAAPPPARGDLTPSC